MRQLRPSPVSVRLVKWLPRTYRRAPCKSRRARARPLHRWKLTTCNQYADMVKQVDAVHCLAVTIKDIEGHLAPIGGRNAPQVLLESLCAIVFGVPTCVGEQVTRPEAFRDATSRAMINTGISWKDTIVGLLATCFMSSFSLTWSTTRGTSLHLHRLA